jgi:hypothetical protein
VRCVFILSGASIYSRNEMNNADKTDNIVSIIDTIKDEPCDFNY